MPAQTIAIAGQELVARYRKARERTRELFAIPAPEAYYDRPIPLRNPIIFYDGHLPAFAVNTLVKLARHERGVDAHFESLFARGIDPEDETAVRDPAELWPSRSEVEAYGREAEALIERALLDLAGDDLQIEAAAAVIEHELMHQETFAYMLHALPYRRKLAARVSSPAPVSNPPSGGGIRAPKVSRIPAGAVLLGNDGSSFGWDNEFPQQRVDVASFEIDACNVTNGDYLLFMQATGAPAPHFWSRRDGRWFWRGMFEEIPLPLEWPVWVTHEEAQSYARWRGCRLPTEAEFHRAAEGLDWQRVSGNFDFQRWEPQPAGLHGDNVSAFGVRDLIGNGWEWTSTTFAPFDGFRPMPSYPGYSADFFDGQHFVMKGASPATARELLRPAFRNWFRPNYPFVWAAFRCVR